MFVLLRTHSYFSFLRGLASPTELAKTAADHGMHTLALTDVHSLVGSVEFYDACQAYGIRPIIGLELNVEHPEDDHIRLIPPKLSSKNGQVPSNIHRLVFLAMDITGWSSLCKLSSAVQLNTDFALPFEQLASNTKGLLCLAGEWNESEFNQFAQSQEKISEKMIHCLKDLFPGRLYIELQPQQKSNDDARISWLNYFTYLSKKKELPVVLTKCIYYLRQEDESLQRIINAIRLNRPVKEIPLQYQLPSGLHFPGINETIFPQNHLAEINIRSAIQNTFDLTERCNLRLPLGEMHYPLFRLPDGQSPIQLLRKKALHGAQKRYINITSEIQGRLEHEIRIIDKCGYASLFLIMEEIIQYSRQQGIPISSRGSAASSLVAYCLGLTSPDPIRLDLYFERFLNPSRATPPDIDTDVSSKRRDDLINFVYHRFGVDRVAMVSTINRFRRRSALRETAKALGYSTREINKLVEYIPDRWFGSLDNDQIIESSYIELEKDFNSAEYSILFETAKTIIGLPRHCSIHPGGIIISPGPMTDLVPTHQATKGITITQFDLHSIERLGLLKIDLLGIRGLSVLGDVAHSKYVDRKSEILSPMDFLDSIPGDDVQTANLVRSGRTIGCFQIESPGMRTTLKEIQADDMDDIMVALALYRPGPLTGGLKSAFIERYRENAKIRQQGQIDPQSMEFQLHPSLTNILEETYGVILYQEQVLRIAYELAGFTLAEADLLRRAMSHFDPGKKMESLKDKFIIGSKTINNIPGTVAERIWELMSAFAGYGFPKAHAASYAQVAWRSAWCKANYPAIFMAAVLANWGGYYTQRVYITEARRLGLVVRPPHVNYSLSEFSLSFLENQPTLFMGLQQVKGLTQKTQSRIIREMPFHSLADFLSRVDPRPIEVEHLILVGALSGFGSTTRMLRQVQTKQWNVGQIPLFEIDSDQREADQDEEWTQAKMVTAQEAILGICPGIHPLEIAIQNIKNANALTTFEATNQIGQNIRIAGMRQTMRRISTHKEVAYIMSLEDLEGMIDVMIPKSVYQRKQLELKQPGPFIVEGTIDLNPTINEPIMHANNLWYIGADIH